MMEGQLVYVSDKSVVHMNQYDCMLTCVYLSNQHSSTSLSKLD